MWQFLRPFLSSPPVWSQPVDSSGRKNAPPPKLLHICAQTKPAINPSFCVSVWVLNSTWICRLLEGEIGGDLVTTKGTHRGEWEGARGAKKPKCIHSEPGEGPWEPHFSQSLAGLPNSQGLSHKKRPLPSFTGLPSTLYASWGQGPSWTGPLGQHIARGSPRVGERDEGQAEAAAQVTEYK